MKTYEEGLRRGMEEAAELLVQEANSTDSLIEEAPAHTKNRLTAARDALSTMAQTVRKFAADDEWRRANTSP